MWLLAEEPSLIGSLTVLAVIAGILFAIFHPVDTNSRSYRMGRKLGRFTKDEIHPDLKKKD